MMLLTQVLHTDGTHEMHYIVQNVLLGYLGNGCIDDEAYEHVAFGRTDSKNDH